MMMDQSVAQFLDRLADRQPTPGGGSAAGLAGALAAAMARMTAAYSVGPKTEPEKATRVEGARHALARADELLRSLVAMDAMAYEKMTTAAREHGRASAEHAGAVRDAATVPMQIAAMAGQVLNTLSEFRTDCSRYLISDLGVAAVLADATVRAAAYSVRINLPEIQDDTVRNKLTTDLETITAHAVANLDRIESHVKEVMKS